MQRGMFLPKGSPPEAVAALRKAFLAVTGDPGFIAGYKTITGEAPDLLDAQVVQQILDRIRNVDPKVKQILKESIAEK
jgi:tripartite-type tricarboxylate transporter receptor subunit TctC